MSNGVPRLLVSRVSLWQSRACLDSWKIEVAFAPLKDRYAQTSWADHTQRATLTFNSHDYPDWTDDFLNLVITHELYHVLTARTDDALSDSVGRGGAVYKAFAKADEVSADAFATALTKAYKRRRS